MGYRIEYLPIKKVRGAERNRVLLPCLTAMCFLVFALLVNLYWPQGKMVLQHIIFPGKASATAVAVNSLAEEIKSGEDVYQALSTFSRRIKNDREGY